MNPSQSLQTSLLSRPFSAAFLFLLLALTFFSLSGCSVNPVTGERQLLLASEDSDMTIGQQQYQPAQQSQGGAYYLDPELTFYVRQVGEKLAKVSARPDLPYEFVILNNDVPNAWALPSGKIAINRGLLLKLEDEAQLAAVLGHEIVHAAARHSAQQTQKGTLINLGVAGLGIGLSDNKYAQMLIGGAAVGAQLIMMTYSREHELESDKYGIEYMAKAGYDTNASIELQEMFLKLSEGRQSDWVSGLFASHPPSAERVTANRAMAENLGGGTGFRGKEIFDRKLKYVRSKQPAYDALAEANKLAQAEKYTEAMQQINKAIKIEANDASFYAFRGELYKAMGKPKEALADYDRAVALYPELFSNKLGRGEINQQLGNLEAAKADYADANKVVPTSIGYYRLGEIAEAQGDYNRAVGNFRQAAGAQGPVGDAARKKLQQYAN